MPEPSKEWTIGFAEGWRAAMERLEYEGKVKESRSKSSPSPKKKRKASAQSKRYGREFKRLAPKFKTKSGKWKKDGFKRCVKAAHKAAKRCLNGQ